MYRNTAQTGPLVELRRQIIGGLDEHDIAATLSGLDALAARQLGDRAETTRCLAQSLRLAERGKLVEALVALRYELPIDPFGFGVRLHGVLAPLFERAGEPLLAAWCYAEGARPADAKRLAPGLGVQWYEVRRVAAEELVKRLTGAHQPDDPRSGAVLAQAMCDGWQWQQAATLAAQCIDRAPDCLLAHLALARALRDQQEHEPAVTALEQGAAQLPDHEALLDVQATILSHAIGDHARARAALWRAVRIDPSEDGNWFMLYVNLLADQRRDEAVELLEELLAATAPADPHRQELERRLDKTRRGDHSPESLRALAEVRRIMFEAKHPVLGVVLEHKWKLAAAIALGAAVLTWVMW